MRVEPFSVGSYVHVLKRGARGLPIVKDESEKWRFLKILFYMNDENLPKNWERETENDPMFSRPPMWPERSRIVKILGFVLMPNHFHLLLQEIREGGVSDFMRKIGNSMSGYFNLKHNEKGSIFQGSYKSRTINDDRQLQYLAAYIMVKNAFELYPLGGIKGAVQNIDEAWEWASKYPFGSLPDYVGNRNSSILDKDILGKIFDDPSDFKSFAKDVILGKYGDDFDSEKILLES